MVDCIWAAVVCGLISRPGTMPVGLSLKLAGTPTTASVPVQFGGPTLVVAGGGAGLGTIAKHPLPTGLGNNQPAAVLYGYTVLMSSICIGLWSPLEPV